jgi:hypothetical protein
VKKLPADKTPILSAGMSLLAPAPQVPGDGLTVPSEDKGETVRRVAASRTN